MEFDLVRGYLRDGRALQFQGTVNQYGYGKLSAAIDATATTIPVYTTANFLDEPPFYVYIGSEAIRVTAKTSNSLTVIRGQDYSTAASHSKDVAVTWSRHRMGEVNSTSGPHAVTGNYTHNLVHQRERRDM